MTARGSTPQLALFQGPHGVLADDERGRIVYTPHGVPKTAQAVGERISLALRVKPLRAAGAERRPVDPYWT